MAINYWGKLAEGFGNFYKALRRALNNPGDIPITAQNNDAIGACMEIWKAIGELDLAPLGSPFPIVVSQDSLIGIRANNTFNSYPINLPSGFIRLDENGKIPTSFLPPISTGLTYGGTWNAATNVPPLASGGLVNGVQTANGYFVICSIGGTRSPAIDGESNFNPGDQMISDGVKWIRIPDNNSVLSVNGLTGEVALTPAIIGAQPLGDRLTAIQNLSWPNFFNPGLLGFNGVNWNFFQINSPNGIATLNSAGKLVQMPSANDVGADVAGTAANLMQAHTLLFDHDSFVSQDALSGALDDHESEWDHSTFLTRSEAAALYISRNDFLASITELEAETINATTVVLEGYPLNINESITISGHLVAKGVEGLNIGKVIFFHFAISAINDGSESRIISSPGFESEITARGDVSAGWSALIEINQGLDTLEIRVTGDSATRVRWKSAFLVTKF